MPQNPSVRTLMDSQHVKVPETLLQSEWQYFFRIFWSVGNKMSYEKSFLVVSEILRLFVNMLTPDDKYTLSLKASV